MNRHTLKQLESLPLPVYTFIYYSVHPPVSLHAHMCEIKHLQRHSYIGISHQGFVEVKTGGCNLLGHLKRKQNLVCSHHMFFVLKSMQASFPSWKKVPVLLTYLRGFPFFPI